MKMYKSFEISYNINENDENNGDTEDFFVRLVFDDKYPSLVNLGIGEDYSNTDRLTHEQFSKLVSSLKDIEEEFNRMKSAQ